MATTITNTADGPRGVNLEDGTTVFVDPGQSIEVEGKIAGELYDGLKTGKAAAASEDDGPKALAKMNKAELLSTAAAEGVTVAKNGDAEVPVADAINAQIVAAIEAKRATAS